MSRKSKQTGFALMLVLIVVSAGVILGLSYLSSASLHVDASRNFQALSRARYVAESGLEHAVYMLRDDPDQFDGSVAAPLGPFHVDGGNDSYTVSAEEIQGQTDQYLLTARGASGDSQWTAQATVQYVPGSGAGIPTGLMIGAGLGCLPLGLTVNGDVHMNGTLINTARIRGDVSATSRVYDLLGRITGDITQHADPVPLPDIRPNHYDTYNLSGHGYSATEYSGSTLDRNNPLTRGGAVTGGNVGGVVRLRPAHGNVVRIDKNVDFTGTLVIDGHLVLDGKNTTLTSVDGFPVIVATGAVWISRDAKNVVMNGAVVTGEGFLPWDSREYRSRTTVNGTVVGTNRGYSAALFGDHTVNYDEQKATLYDFSGGGAAQGGGEATVTVLTWHK